MFEVIDSENWFNKCLGNSDTRRLMLNVSPILKPFKKKYLVLGKKGT